ncbi:MAG: sulfotransferase family protein [Lysobacteraceae bacterium]|nr:MAG: sulfotransferase family protein [Xanthomonadaceae bacterium]
MHGPPPSPWLQAQQYATTGNLDAARQAFEALLAQEPRHAGAHALLASVLLAQGHLRDACTQLLRAADASPPDPQFILRIAHGLRGVGEANAALQCMRQPALAQSRDPAQQLALAHLYQGFGLNPEALRCMQGARESGLDSPDFRYFHALQLQFNGAIAEAEAGMEACLRMGPTFGRASLSLARIRRQTAQSNHVDFIRARLAQAASGSEDQAAFEFALYEELDDLGEHQAAWDALARGNAIMRARTRYDARVETRLIDGLVQAFDRDIADDAGTDGPMPIFIVGLPRSGTTLLERILGTHSQVASAGELTDLPKQLRWVADRHGHALLDDGLLAATGTLDFAELGRRYLQQTQWRARGRRHYVDKLPPNWMLVGHVRRALPRAKVLHLLRDPMDVCFSNWRALFGDAYAYSYDFDALAHQHRLYRRLMAHWHRVHPGFVLDVPYADLVREPETTCRRVLDFCGLPFEAECLDHTRNRSSVSTLSSAQVREPIHARGIGEWRRHARQLEPLRKLLDA